MTDDEPTKRWNDYAAAWTQDRVLEQADLERLRGRPEYRDFFGLRYGDVSADGAAVVGRDGFIFVNDGSNRWRDQLAGSFIAGDEVIAQTASALRDIAAAAEGRGIAFHILFVPEKDVVHPELSPNADCGVTEVRTIHRILDHLKIPAVYPLAAMTDAARHLRLFHARNSHSNFFGGLITANALLEVMGRQPLDLTAVASEQMERHDDLSAKWVAGLVTRRRAVARIYHEDILADPPGHAGKHIVLTHLGAQTDTSLMIFGDSYAWNYPAGLSRFMTAVFRTVHFIWDKQIDWALVDRVRPQALVMQSAERFLVRPIISNGDRHVEA